MGYTRYNTVLLSLTKEWNSDTSYPVGEPEKQANWSQSETQGQRLHGGACVRYQENSHSQNPEAEWWWPGACATGRWGIWGSSLSVRGEEKVL